MNFRVFLVGAGLCLGMTPASALEAHVAKETPGSAAAVWGAIGDFCGIATWHPAVASCTLSTDGRATMRTLTLQDGGKILEKQTAFDADGMSYSYEIVESPLPVQGYASTLKVIANGKGATIDWSGSFDAKGAPDADAVETITGIYQAGVDSLVDKTAK